MTSFRAGSVAYENIKYINIVHIRFSKITTALLCVCAPDSIKVPHNLLSHDVALETQTRISQLVNAKL